MTVRIQLRHDTESHWNAVKSTEVLFKGELGFVIDNEANNTITRFKVGNGIDTWEDLPYYDTEILKHIHTFVNNIIFEKNADIEGVLTVTGSFPVSHNKEYNIEGIAHKAVEDKLGNQIDTFYQPLLQNSLVVDYNTRWNTVIDEGVYAVRSEFAFDDTGKNQPIGASQNGILSVHKDSLNHTIQMYMQDNLQIISRYNNGASWTAWGSITDHDTSLVHTFGNESIDGQKTFNDIITSTNGTINLDSSSVNIQKEGNTLLAQDAQGVITLGNISITGNVIDGHCTKDGDGNIIKDTYILKGDNATPLYSLNIPNILTSVDYPEYYEEVIERKYSYYDSSKIIPIGNPDIDDYRVDNPTNSDYVKTQPFTAIGNNDFRIGFRFKTNTVNYSNGYVFDSNTNNDLSLLLGTGPNITAYVGGTAVCTINSNAYVLGATYRGYLERKNGNYTLWYKRIDNDATASEVHKVENSSTTVYPLNTTELKLGTGTNPQMSIYMNYVSVIVNNEERFFARMKDTDIIFANGTLSIPYSRTKGGAKIAESSSLNAIEECYGITRTANYFIINDVIDENEQWFRFPYDNATGFCQKLYHWRSGANMCEYDTDLECVQSGICTNGTAITFKKPFADNNYSLISPAYSAKTATGFTPSADGYYIARGRITLDSNLT